MNVQNAVSPESSGACEGRNMRVHVRSLWEQGHSCAWSHVHVMVSDLTASF